MSREPQGRRSLRYIRLAAFFAGQPAEVRELHLRFEEVEELLGESLPSGARYPSWWRNDEHRVHSRAWLSAGWSVRPAESGVSEISFERVPGADL